MTQFVVVDSSPFINQSVDLYGKNLVTIAEVIAELKDKKTRELMQNHQIPLKTVSDEALKAVIAFSKLTGDYSSLSMTDLKVDMIHSGSCIDSTVGMGKCWKRSYTKHSHLGKLLFYKEGETKRTKYTTRRDNLEKEEAKTEAKSAK
jgi:hypothetical protein